MNRISPSLVAITGALAAVLLAGGSPRPASAEATQPLTLYVDRDSVGGTCSDSRPAATARSTKTPWCSLERAVAAAPSGATVLVRAGTYPELEISRNHTRSERVLFKRYDKENVVLEGLRTKDASLLRFHGFRITSYVKLGNGSRSIELVANDLSPHGIHMRGVDGVLILGNRIHDIAPRAADGTCGCAIWAQYWDEPGVRNVTVRANTIVNLGGDGVHFGNGRNIVIEYNTIMNALKTGNGDHVDTIQIMRAYPLVIRGNLLRGNQHGIMFTDHASPGVVIENNVIADMGSYGINAGDIPDARIVNNTFWNNRYGAALIRDDKRDPAEPVNVVFKNNILDAQRSNAAWFAEHDYNLIAKGERYGRHDRGGTPRFVDAAAGDFRLARNSAGIDIGTSAGTPTRDRWGRLRRDHPTRRNLGGGRLAYYDIGAHEYQPPQRAAKTRR